MDGAEANSDQSVHIHNYSLFAVHSFILEVKKYPIIYNGNTHIPFSKGLIDFAWARILASLLDNSSNFDLAQKNYWERSFRELWNWMRSTLVKDMIARGTKPTRIRNPDYNWLMYLRFLEPYIQLDETSQLDPDIHVQVIKSKDSEQMEPSEHTIIWLRDSTKPVDSESKHISICLRTSSNTCIDFNRKPEVGAFFQLSGGDIQHPAGLSSAHMDSQPFPPFIETFKTGRSTGPDTVLPMQKPTFYTVLDEDFTFIMSLLPKLHEMEPRKNTEVKLQMIQALHEVL